MQRAQNAQTPKEQEQLKAELANDIEQATTYFDTVQGFFGYGAIAEKKRAHAEKQKHLLESKLAQEEIRYSTLTSTQAKEKSLKKQNNLKNKIHMEKIALGQAWSWQQKALLGALAVATAYVGYQYGGTAVSAAKEWWNGKSEEIIQSPIETPPTISEQFTKKFTQLKERGKELQQTTTEKIKSYLTPSTDQQNLQPQTKLSNDSEVIAMREYYGRRYDAEKKRSPEKNFDEIMTVLLTEQKKDQALVNAQKNEIAKTIKIDEYLTTKNLPAQQKKNIDNT